MDQMTMLKRSRQLQAWRPDELTLDLDRVLSAPFCPKCVDWHTTKEDHSLINRDGVWESLIPLECLLCPAVDWSHDGTLPNWSTTPDMGGELSDLCPRCTAATT